MKKEISRIVGLWKEEMCDHIRKYSPYNPPNQLNQMAAFFSPGLFYYYIMNFHNLEMEYVHPGTKDILGINPEAFTMPALLQRLPSKELELLEKKETLVADFLFRFLSPEELPSYKIIYFFKMRDKDGRIRNMLHQATTLTVSDTGKVEHVLGVQTDVSQIGINIKTDTVSFISLTGGKSYYNLEANKLTFDPEDKEINFSLSSILSKRELQIVKLLSEGLSNAKAASELNISYHTLRTHRKNILKKTKTNNIAELVTQCLMEGII